MQVIGQLREMTSPSLLKKASKYEMVKDIMSRRQSKLSDSLQAKLVSLRAQFQMMDRDGSGCINKNELTQVMKDVNIGVQDGEIERIVDQIDYVGNGMINYTEFLAATLQFNDEVTDDILLRLFKKFDVDDTNYISKENLMAAF